MTVEAISGPFIVFKDGGVLPGSPSNQNPDQAPSLFNQATGLLDPRLPYTYIPGERVGGTGWLNATFQVADYAPGTASTTALSAAATVSTTSIKLITVSSGCVTTASTLTNASTGASVTGVWLIDNVPGQVAFGTSGVISIWDPANPAIGRAVSITSGGNTSAITFTVSGYDAYGYPITQSLSGPNTTTVASVYTGKTFKWVSAVTASGTTSTTVSVGVADIYGLPLYAPSIGYIDVWFNGVSHYTSNTASAFTAGTTLTTAGASDVRGSYNISTGLGAASGSGKTMQIWQSISPANISSNAGIVGVTPA